MYKYTTIKCHMEAMLATLVKLSTHTLSIVLV